MDYRYAQLRLWWFADATELGRNFYRASDGVLQAFVAIAGSSYTFGITVFLVSAWGVAGAWFAGSQIWQIAMQVTPPSLQHPPADEGGARAQ